MGSLCDGINNFGCQHCCLLAMRLLAHLPIQLEDTDSTVARWLHEDFNWDDPLEAQMAFPETYRTFGDVVITLLQSLSHGTLFLMWELNSGHTDLLPSLVFASWSNSTGVQKFCSMACLVSVLTV